MVLFRGSLVLSYSILSCYHIQVEILATTSLEKRLRAIDKTLDHIQAAAVGRQGQGVAVATRPEELTSDSGHQTNLRQQTGESLHQQESQGQHMATTSHQLPHPMFSARFLGDNGERVGIMESS
jgi:hypothetical protein